MRYYLLIFRNGSPPYNISASDNTAALLDVKEIICTDKEVLTDKLFISRGGLGVYRMRKEGKLKIFPKEK